MKFVKIETGWGGWDEYTDQGVFVQHLTNHEHYVLVQQAISHHAGDWMLHMGLWITHGSHYMGDWLINSMFQ